MSNIDMVTWHFDVIIYGINHSKHVNHCDGGSLVSAKTFSTQIEDLGHFLGSIATAGCILIAD